MSQSNQSNVQDRQHNIETQRREKYREDLQKEAFPDYKPAFNQPMQLFSIESCDRKTKLEQWKRDIEDYIREKKDRQAQEKTRERIEDQKRLIIDSYYNDFYPIYKTEYPLGLL